MNNFRLVCDGVNLSSVRMELSESTFWVDMNAKPNAPPTHARSHRIQMRGNKKIPGCDSRDIHEVENRPAWESLLHTRALLTLLVAKIGGELGQVRISRLWPGAFIPPHMDVGEYCAIRDRYHLVIGAVHGTEFTVADETIVMKEGEVWWFDNKMRHSVRNLSASSPRTHLIFDVLP